jgi:Zn-dependent protease with chaperone function
MKLSREQASEFWNHVGRVSEQLSALPPENIVVGLDPNFFVTEADVTCLDGELSGRTMYCSLLLSRIMTVDELAAVIGHELAHFKGLDTQFSQNFYPIYRGTITSILSLRESAEGWRSIAILPAVAILSYFLECFSLAETRIGRDRELMADKEGASITSPTTIASALVKVHAFSPLWAGLQDAAGEALRSGKAFINVSKTFAEVAATARDSTVFDGIAERHLTHPTDSHPPLGVRLEGLGVTLPEVATAALLVNPPNAAIQLIPDYESKEEQISVAFHAILGRNLGIDLSTEGETS